MYAIMDEAERRHLMESLIDKIQIYEERQPNGQWLKSIRFKLPIIDADMSLSLDKDSHIETVCLLYHKKNDFIRAPYDPKNEKQLKNMTEKIRSGSAEVSEP